MKEVTIKLTRAQAVIVLWALDVFQGDTEALANIHDKIAASIKVYDWINDTVKRREKR